MSSSSLQLKIHATGLCCSLGYQHACATAALRAGMDHFRKSQFFCNSGLPITVASVNNMAMTGASHLANMAEMAITDLIEQLQLKIDFTDANFLQKTRLILICPSSEISVSRNQFYKAIVDATAKKLQFKQSVSWEIGNGSCSVATALKESYQVLKAGQYQQVLLIGIDSFLNVSTIGSLLSQERILTNSNSAGFIPGEAAFASFITLAHANSKGLVVKGVEWGQEQSIESEVPNRSIVLTQVIRQALAQANMDITDIDCRLSDQNGEPPITKEYSNAMTRICFQKHHNPESIALAYQTGNVGSASFGVMSAYFAAVAPRDDGPGKNAIFHLANDNGARAAFVLAWQ